MINPRVHATGPHRIYDFPLKVSRVVQRFLHVPLYSISGGDITIKSNQIKCLNVVCQDLTIGRNKRFGNILKLLIPNDCSNLPMKSQREMKEISRERYKVSTTASHLATSGKFKWNQPHLSTCIISRASSRTYRRLPGPRSSCNSISTWIASQEYFMRATHHFQPL